jgi:SAM-dependent methyltransferase
LQTNPTIEWYRRHKCPDIVPWLIQVLSGYIPSSPPSAYQIHQAELKILRIINDLVVYVVDPSIYDAQPFLNWGPDELRQRVDFTGKTVIDIGSGTGKLAFIAAESATVVYAIEPVGNLRCYIKQKACSPNFTNVFPMDGLITDLPLPAGFADITMGGHVFGDHPELEYNEMKRTTIPGGMLILCPGSSQS